MRRTTANSSRWPLEWSTPITLFSGRKGHCRERRWTHRHVGCEFDGRFGYVRHRGRHLFYARANLHTLMGGRHVQVRASRDGLLHWSNFTTVNISSVRAGLPDSNIYFFLVAPLVLPSVEF